MTLQGSFSLGLSSDGNFHFTLEDETSGAHFLNVSITPEQLALAISGRGAQKVPFDVVALHRVGEKRFQISFELPNKDAISAAVSKFQHHKDKAERARLHAEFRAELLVEAGRFLEVYHPEAFEKSGWMIGSDGVGMQQSGTGWKIHLVRFEPVEAQADA